MSSYFLCKEGNNMQKGETTVGSRIRLARVGLTLTQKQLAQAVGVSANHLAMVERV